MVTNRSIRFALFALFALMPALESAAADTLVLHPDRVVGGEAATVTLTLDQAPDQDTSYPISLSGRNSARTAAAIKIPAGRVSADFSVTSAVASNDEFVDIAVSDPVTRTTLATTRLAVTPAILSALTLDKSAVVGGTPGSAVTATVRLQGVAGDAGLSVLLGQSCPDCLPGFELVLPASVQIPRGARSAVFTFETRVVTSGKEFAILASLAGVTKTANLDVNQLRPQSISVSPASISGALKTTVTVTLSAPAYAGYELRITCSQPLASDVPPTKRGCHASESNEPNALRIAVPSGQTSASFQLHNTQATSLTQVTVRAHNVGMNGEVNTTLAVAP